MTCCRRVPCRTGLSDPFPDFNCEFWHEFHTPYFETTVVSVALDLEEVPAVDPFPLTVAD